MKLLRKLIYQVMKDEFLRDVLVELDPEKRYILFLPGDMNEEDLRNHFESLRGKVNLVVVTTDSAKLLELT